jgi:hypothetical protein
MEVAVTLSVVVVGLIVFRFAAQFLPVYHTPRPEAAQEEPRSAIYAQP